MPSNNHDVIKAIIGDVTIEAAAGEAKGPPRFEVAAYNGGPLNLPNFDLPVYADLSTLKYATSIVAHLDHKRDQRVGHVTDKTNDGKSLILAGLASAETIHRDEVVKSAANQFKWQASIEAAKDTEGTVELVPVGKRAQVNGRTIQGPAYIARRFTLTGFSFVSHGADGSTTVRIAASKAAGFNPKGMTMKLDEFIEARGFDPSSLTDKQRESLEAMFNAQHGDGSAPSLDDIFAARKADQTRIDAIARMTDTALRDNPNRTTEIEAMSRMAVNDKWSAEKYELELLRSMRPQAHPPHASRRGTDAKVLEAALAMTCDLENIEAHYSEQTLEAAHSQYKNGLGLQELLLITAQERGFKGRSLRGDLEDALHYACDRNIQASGFSTISLPTTLGNVANLLIKESFDKVEAEWKKICARKTVTNFHTHTTAALTGDFTFQKVGPDGQLKHGQVGEATYTNKAETYGRMFAITRQDWINDNLGALTGIRKRIGRGGALAMNDAFWTKFLNNTSFFTSARGNFDDGADTEFSADALTAADVLFRSQTDPDGKPLGSMPRILVVPPAYRVPALRLMNSQQLLSANDDGGSNPWAGMFEVVSSVYMANSSFTGYSAKKWYLLADPSDIPVIEVALLNGNESPTVDSAEADFNVLGIQFRGYHDFGFELQEYRGGVAMKGEV